MQIENINIQNFKSIKTADIEFEKFNVFIGQNNHGKTNVFEAINWFFNGKPTGNEIQHMLQNCDVVVSVTFSGLQKALENMGETSTHRRALTNIFGESDEITIKRTTENDYTVSNRYLYNPQNHEWENPLGRDTAWRPLLPGFEFVRSQKKLEDVSKYTKTSPIGEMLSGILEAIVEEDPYFQEFRSNFEEIFITKDDNESRVRESLNQLGEEVRNYLSKQFPDSTSVHFSFEEPAINDLLKKFQSEIDDGIPTSAEEKGDGMQRALMLAIIQAYSDFRKQREEIKKNFIFAIDEAELHLHPTAQRALKESLKDISEQGDQVLVNTHSSVLLTDVRHGDENKTYTVEKQNRVTEIVETEDTKKPYLVFDLLGGSPADLLLPPNFLLVEGYSEVMFIRRMVERFYDDSFADIQIVPANGDITSQKRSFHNIRDAFEIFNTDRNPYFDKVIILCDKPSNQENVTKLEEFKQQHPELESNERLHVINTKSLEEYYPQPYTKDPSEVVNLSGGKVEYAKHVAANVSQEDFESGMKILHRALNRARELGF